ncbi:Hypothetical predicted protein [Podarcis lilfordi]|uniref:Uncharacterized protein n=1 Tax=Podarcis lilfordi TaxID=74358 RepID=A0AA35LL52_9SAUR|nr:Hypothetical predicted protein [Podarcis lilfordi]
MHPNSAQGEADVQRIINFFLKQHNSDPQLTLGVIPRGPFTRTVTLENRKLKTEAGFPHCRNLALFPFVSQEPSHGQ